MKKIILVVAAALAIQTSALYATNNTESAKQGQNKMMQMDASNSDMGMMKQNMHKMMKQMDEIHSTKDPKRRQQLMHEHMQNMHKGMKMMREMGGDMMMGMTDGKKGKGGSMGNQEKGQRHQMMEQRMDMMQMMMEQMMGRMSMQEGMMPKMK